MTIKIETKKTGAAMTSGLTAEGMQINYTRKPAPTPPPERKTLKESGALREVAGAPRENARRADSRRRNQFRGQRVEDLCRQRLPPAWHHSPT